MENHLGDEDTVTPSTYSEVFANPTMLVSWQSVFPPVPSPPGAFALGGGPIIVPPQPTPTPAQSANLNAVTAALGLSSDDVSAILAATTPATANTLTLATLNVLFQYARLASSLSLTISDLILWIQLTGGTPFGTTPADTLEFLRRLAVLRSTGIAVHDLDYLLRSQSASQSSLALTAIQATAILQTIHDAIAKLTPAAQGDAPTVQTIFVAALAAATNVTANVVTPVLAKTGMLPLPAATIALLLASPTVDPTQFPQLVAGFTAVAKAAALFTALGVSEIEFAFVVQNAASFNWLDPSQLPSTTTSPYAPFEALLRAIKLDHRQSARTPKLFDVLGAWLVAGALPADLPTAIGGGGANNLPPLASALNASVADVTAVATALGAAPPSLTAGSQPGSLADMAMLTTIGNALDVVARYSISATTLVSLGTATPVAGTATAAFGAFQAQYPQSAWFGVVQPVEDGLRQSRRDALVAYLLGPGASLIPGTTFVTTDDLFDYFLIDPEMSACAVSTRLLQASLAIQQFVQQCFLNLTIQVTVDTTSSAWSEWSWRQQYRLWQANREVFLYPENYVLPELRTNASSFFTDLESDLRQSNCDADAAEAAFENYLRKLVDVSRLVVAAHYNQTTAQGSILHVFAHTRGTPWKWYYRTQTTSAPSAAGVWSAWEALNLDIASDQLIPVIWDQRLHLLWPVFKPESEKQRDQAAPSSAEDSSQSAPAKFWAVDLAMSELSAGQWQAKRVLTEKMFFKKTEPTVSVDLVDRPPLAFTFRASQDPAFDLVITVYYNWSKDEHHTGPETTRTATGTLSMPEAPLTVVQDPALLPGATLVDPAQEPTYALVTSTTLSGSLATPSHYNFSGQDLVYGFYYTPNPGSKPLYVLGQSTDERADDDGRAARHGHEPAPRHPSAGGGVRLPRSVLRGRRRRGHRFVASPPADVPRRARVFHGFQLARPRPRRRPATDDALRLSDVLSSVRADHAPRARDRRRVPAHGAQPPARPPGRARLDDDVQLQVHFRSAAAGCDAVSRRSERAGRGRERARLRPRKHRRLLALQLGALLPRADVRRLAAHAEPAISGHDDLAGIHLQPDRLERPTGAAAILGDGAVLQPECDGRTVG